MTLVYCEAGIDVCFKYFYEQELEIKFSVNESI